MKKKVTIHDLARELKLDSSTVSRALSDSPRVKTKTKDLVLAKAAELGYSRNMLASNLRSQKTQTVGVIVPHISRHFFSTVIAGIEDMAYRMGYNVIIAQSNDKSEKERRLVETLISNQVDGIMLSLAMDTDNYDHLIRVEDQGIPVVFFDRKCDALKQAVNVTIDDRKMAFDATELFIKKGRKRIAYFTGSAAVSIYKDRLLGYQTALRSNNRTIDEDLIFESKLRSLDGIRIARQILEMENKPDAILSANDVCAISAMQVFVEHGIKIPTEISLMGFSDEPLTAYTSPPLSSINQNPYQMGQLSFSKLLSMLQGETPQLDEVLVDSEIIIRKSI